MQSGEKSVYILLKKNSTVFRTRSCTNNKKETEENIDKPIQLYLLFHLHFSFCIEIKIQEFALANEEYKESTQ